MLTKATLILGCKLEAGDGEVGTVKDILFDEATWNVRYLVVETGGWLSGRSVHLTPGVVANFSEVNRILTTSLSKERIETSPDFDPGARMTRPDEELLHSHYGWEPYWKGEFIWPSPFAYPTAMPSSPELASARPEPMVEEVDGSLRSLTELKRFALRATDGDVGEVKDVFLETEAWRVTHVVADAKPWWPGGDVVIDVALVEEIDGEDQVLVVDLTKEQVKESPAYDAGLPFSDDYLLGLSGYYMALARQRNMPLTRVVAENENTRP